MQLSIILPVYNVEKYLRKCLDSIFTQNASEDQYEVILINDGSTDGSLDIAKEYETSHTNLILIDQENQGQSCARNNGIKVSRGKYVWTVDSDDWIDRKAFETLFPILKEGCDIVTIGIARVKNGKVDYHPGENLVCTGKEYQMRFGCVGLSPKNLFRRQFLVENELWFYPGIYHEDIEFMSRAYYYAEKFKQVDYLAYYINRDNETSTTAVPRIKRCYDYNVVAKALINFADTKVETGYRPVIYRIASQSFSSALRISNLAKEEERAKFISDLCASHPPLDKFMQSDFLRYKIMACVCMISIRLYATIINKNYRYMLTNVTPPREQVIILNTSSSILRFNNSLCVQAA